jgi:hypothetical protein
MTKSSSSLHRLFIWRLFNLTVVSVTANSLKVSWLVVLTATASFLVSCASYSAKTEAKSGGDFLISLHQKGQLPGDANNEHGKIICYLSPIDLKEVTYPLSRTYQVVKTGDPCTNHYTILRLAKHSTWQLQRGWRTDSEGRVTEEWIVK